MRNKFIYLSAVTIILAVLGGCGSNHHHVTQPTEVPVVLTVHDQPAGVQGLTVLSFGIDITGVTLQGTGSQNGNVVLFQGNSDVQLQNLATPQQQDLLATGQAPAGTYNSITITFSTANATLSNTSGTTFTDGTTSCSSTNGTICQINPAVTTMTEVYTFPTAIIITAGQPVNLAIDFNENAALVNTTGTLSVNPAAIGAITVTANTTAGNDGNLVDISNMTGTVSNVGTNQFTFTDSTTGNQFTVSTNTNTTFPGCTGGGTTFSTCVVSGQIVTLGQLGISDNSPTTLTASTIFPNNNVFTNGIEGTVVATTPTPMIVVTGISGSVSGVTVGQELTLSPNAGATFSVFTPSGETLPSGLSFASTTDLIPGQNVLIDSTGVVNNVVSADQIQLEPSTLSGTVTSSTSPNVTIGDLNGFLTTNGINSIQVQTGNQTQFFGSTTGFNSLTVGNPFTFNGLLFNNGVNGPALFDMGAFGATD